MGQYRYTISLSLMHPSMDPEEMSRALGRSPRRSWKAGEPRTTPRGDVLGGTHDETYWVSEALSAEEDSERKCLSAALDDCLDILAGHRDFLAGVRARGGEAALRVGWFLEAPSTGDTLEWDLLKRLGELGVDLMMFVYEREQREHERDGAGGVAERVTG